MESETDRGVYPLTTWSKFPLPFPLTSIPLPLPSLPVPLEVGPLIAARGHRGAYFLK